MDDFESVFYYANGHQFLSVIAPVHHQRIGQTFDNGALRRNDGKLFLGVFFSSVLPEPCEIVSPRIGRPCEAKTRRVSP